MTDIYREDIATIDLAEPLHRDHVGKTYATGDKLGNRVGVRVRRNHADVDLTGHAATGYFIRPDLKTVVIHGKVEGSAAWVEIPKACLIERGPFTLAIKISGGDVVQTVRVVDGSLILISTDELIDPGDVVPTLDDIFAQIAAMEAATQAATDAAAMASKATVGLVNAVNAQLRQIAPPIINTATGDGVITVQDSAERTLSGLRLYGKTTQDGTPSPVAPVPMVNVGASGSITVTVEDVGALTVQTPDGLPGIPVSSGGNYTDASGQQWLCDEIDFGRGVHVQRVGVMTCDGSEDWNLRAVSGAAAYQFTLYGVGAAADGVAMATSLPGAISKEIIATDFAGDAIGVGTAAYYSGALIVRMAQSHFTGDDVLAEFKAMLAATPMVAAYQLSEPVETPLPEETQAAYAELKTLYPATTVRNDAGAWMEMSYVADTKTYVDKTGGGIGAETDPTVPAWAKQPEKPTYTAQEVGALPEDAEIVDATARKDIAELSKEIEELKENGGTGGTGADAVVRELLEVVPKASKNLNTIRYEDRSANGVTFKVNQDNTIDLSGTPTANTSLLTGGASANIARGFTLQPGTYRLSGGVDGYVNLICLLYNGAGTLLSETVEIGYGKTISVTEECTCCVNIQARANKAMDGITVKAQLEAGTVTTEYVSPFSEDKRSKRLDDAEKRLDKIENSSGGLADEVPAYWEKSSGYLTGKVETIRTLMRGCAEHGDIFYFLTDAHWHLNEKHSPAIIAWLNEHINVPRMINGGDITDEYDEEPSRLYRKAMGNGEYYFVDGNHEFLANKTYADNFYANRMFADKAVYGDENRTYYYVDNPAGKMRYIVLATFGPWVDGSESMVLNTTEQKDWLKNVALNVEEGWTVIVFAHIYSIENGRYIAGGETMLNYMADMTKGEVACVIQGDQHSDYILPSYADKIPIVCTTCDKNKGNEIEDLANRATGTVNEQAFDVVVLDKAQKQLHFVRIGYAKDGDEIRTVSYGAANL